MAFQLANTMKDGSKSPLALDMIAVIMSIRQTRKYMNIKKVVEFTELSDVINRHLKTNITVKINPNLFTNANMSIPLLTRNNVMWSESYRKWFPAELERTGEELIKKSSSHIVAGEINTDGSLSGDFCKLEGEINLSYDMIHPKRWKITPAGVVGITLHEIGHFINFLRALTWTARTNYVLHQLHAMVMGNVPRNHKVKFMKQIAKNEGLDIDADIKECPELDNDKTVITIFVGAMTRKMRSELGDDVYVARGFEALSDNFAAQHGCGLDLVLALDSMPHMRFNKKGTPESMILNAAYYGLQLMAFITNPGLYAFVTWLMMTLYDPSGVIYDAPKDRYRHIALAMIAKLSQNRDGDNARLIKEIEQIMDIMKDYNDGRSHYQTLYEYLTPTGRNNITVRDLNQALEDLAANNLYVAAAKFQQLGK